MMQNIKEQIEIEEILKLKVACDIQKIQIDINALLTEKINRNQYPIIYGSTIANGKNVDFEMNISPLMSLLAYEVSDIKTGKTIYKGSRKISIEELISVVSNAALLF